jgi:hypothetical protein
VPSTSSGTLVVECSFNLETNETYLNFCQWGGTKIGGIYVLHTRKARRDHTRLLQTSMVVLSQSRNI